MPSDITISELRVRRWCSEFTFRSDAANKLRASSTKGNFYLPPFDFGSFETYSLDEDFENLFKQLDDFTDQNQLDKNMVKRDIENYIEFDMVPKLSNWTTNC